MKNKPFSPFVQLRALSGIAIFIGVAPLCYAQTTGFNQTGVGPFDYNTTTNWVDDTINGLWSVDLSIPSSQTVTFGADTSLTGGLDFEYTGSANLSLKSTGGARTLTIAGDIIVNTVSTTRTVTFGSNTASENLNVDLGGSNRTFNVGSGRTLGFVNPLSNGGVILNGGTNNFSGANTHSGATVINSGAVGFNGNSGSAANSDVTIKANGTSATTLTFGSSASGSGITRAKSVTFDSSSSLATAISVLSVSGNGSNNTVETITNNLVASKGYGIVNLNPNSNKNNRLSAAAFTRDAGAALLLRGTNLGVNDASSQILNSSNILFSSAPTLDGGNGSAGSSTISILKGACGDITTSGTGTGLVTYDSTYGVRLLDTTTEYTSTITDGQTQLDNVRMVGDGSALGVSVTLGSNTTVNSLSLLQKPAATGGSAEKDGVLINSSGMDTALKISSGVIFVNTNAVNSGDEVQINTAQLDFNNQEALIIATGSGSSGTSNFTISSQIINASAFTKSGNAVVKITGATDNTFTGDTIVAGGALELNKTAGFNALGGNLIVNSGSLFFTAPNQIADGKDITVNGGILQVSPSGGVNSRNETFHNLLVTGGVFNSGTTSGPDTNTISLTNATVTGGTLAVIRKSLVEASGGVSISNGGIVTVDRYNTSSSAKTALSVGSGGLAITQTASGTYSPITLTGGSSAGVKGGELVLNGGLSFIANGSNTNTVTIAAVAASGGGGEPLVLLEGARTFTIGDGPATDDLTVQAALVDGSTAGSLTKAGAGTLVLTGANSYSGNTSVTGGTLTLSQENTANESSTMSIGGSAFLALNFSGSETVDKLFINGVQQAAGVYKSTTNVIDAGTPTPRITGIGILYVLSDPSGAEGYGNWASANVDSQSPDQDYNNDGVSNGIAYFMNNTGVISLPGIVGDAITWTNGGNIQASAYETQYLVQTSPDLVMWSPVPTGGLTANSDGPAGSLTYSLPPGQGKFFVRLIVDPQ